MKQIQLLAVNVHDNRFPLVALSIKPALIIIFLSNPIREPTLHIVSEIMTANEEVQLGTGMSRV